MTRNTESNGEHHVYRERILQDIARRHLTITTIEKGTLKNDEEEFYMYCSWGINSAMQDIFEAGIRFQNYESYLSDQLTEHDIAIWGIEEALDKAFDSGRVEALRQKSRITPEQEDRADNLC